MVKDAYIKYDYIPSFEVKPYGEKGFVYSTIDGECIQSRKVKQNSNYPYKIDCYHPHTNKLITFGGIHNYTAWRRYLGQELYNEVMLYYSKVLNMPVKYFMKKYNLMEASILVSEINHIDKDTLCDKLSKSGKTPITHILKGNFALGVYSTHKSCYPHVVRTGKKQKLCVGGDMIIPITPEVYELLRNGDGVASILDGGVVNIEGVTDYIQEESLEYLGYVKIGNI